MTPYSATMLSGTSTTSQRDHNHQSISLEQRADPTRGTVQNTHSSHRGEQSTRYDVPSQHAGQKRPMVEIEPSDANDNLAVRRRISRACDRCNQQRSKCDGKMPCTNCVDSQAACTYQRAHKKRGRVPKKEQVQLDENPPTVLMESMAAQPGANERIQAGDSGMSANDLVPNMLPANGVPNSTAYIAEAQPSYYNDYDALQATRLNTSSSAMGMPGGFASPNAMKFGMQDSAAYTAGGIDMSGFGFPLGDDHSVAFMGRAPMVESPDWLALTSPMFIAEQWATPPRPPDALRFPVLQVVLPYIESIIPQTLACDLLEQYFGTTTLTGYQPKNPYVLSYIFRKQSILHPTNPRPCTAALLASMLWISAQHSDAALLTTHPDARARTCQKLLELTINMLKPLVHNHGNGSLNSTSSHHPTRIDTSLGGLVLPIDIIAGNEVSRKQVDNIVTYIHLATVVSASERKAASLRWWNAAWSLAREIRLGRELPPEEMVEEEPHVQSSVNEANVAHQPQHQNQRAGSFTSQSTHTENRSVSKRISAEDREERRRTWWLLYAMDRHLALCYNRPMFFLNKECEGLLQPMEESRFQLGQFENETFRPVRTGLNIESSSLSVYGFFLPLMVILGEILDLNYARNRPRFGPRANRPRDFSDTIDEIEDQLRSFGLSLGHVEEQHFRSAGVTTVSASSSNQVERGTRIEQELQTKTVVAYGTHIMHVLHILLTGKWDPIAMLDDNDLWISSQSFINATGHAVSAARALADIIEYDPDLSFMPFFFGIYLLQGSFLLLLFADKLQDNITLEVVKACETIVRAHEACVSTLDTQYQRNFRRVMRSALQQLRGRLHEDATEQQNWRREILKLYRWTGDGTGLAL